MADDELTRALLARYAPQPQATLADVLKNAYRSPVRDVAETRGPNYTEAAPLTPMNKLLLDVYGGTSPDPITEHARQAIGLMGSVGSPIRAYHGMAGPLQGGRFDPARFGQNHWDNGGLFLTTDPIAAHTWAETAADMQRSMGKGVHGEAIVPADVRFKNPLVIENRAAHGDPSQYWIDNKDSIVKRAEQGNHDGIIVRNPGGSEEEATIIARHPGTVTSPTTGDLLYSGLGLPSPPAANGRGGIGSDYAATNHSGLADIGRDDAWQGIIDIGHQRFPDYQPGQRESEHVEERRPGFLPRPFPQAEPQSNLWENLIRNYQRAMGRPELDNQQVLPGPLPGYRTE